jgi:putative methionine-R-sulfoxide reductase with GAF domain
MSANAQVSRPPFVNRRRRVRQRVHAPAYASFSGASKTEMLDLYEVLDISELGVAIQCAAPMDLDRPVGLCLDLAEASGQISASARVIWSDSAGRVGLSFPPLADPAARRLREWLFLNAMAGAANAVSDSSAAREFPALRPNYTDTLTAASAVQREAESLGSDLEAVLSLVAARSRSLLRASGAAIALAGKDPETMICRASVGQSAPPVGLSLQVGSGFSGECVRTGKPLRCDDTETDQRVDRQTSRALGIRSMLAAPVGADRAIGLLEVFSARPNSFSENDSALLQRFADLVLAAVNRGTRPHDSAGPTPVPRLVASPGSVLFAHLPEEKSEANNQTQEENAADADEAASVHLPRTHLYLLIGSAATIALVLGFILAPWIQLWIQGKIEVRDRNGEHTVLASSQAPADATKPASASPAVDSASLEQLRELAKRGDPIAEDKLGRLYAEGDEKQGVSPDDKEAAHWFTSAAEHGNISAQYKLGLLYWGGHHGLPKDANKAYFWTVLARAGGQDGSKDLANLLAGSMPRAQSAAIEQQAEMWYQQHESHGKPSPAR